MNKKIFSQKKRRSIDTNFEIAQVLELAHKNFKAVVIFMLKGMKENMLVMNKRENSAKKLKQ